MGHGTAHSKCLNFRRGTDFGRAPRRYLFKVPHPDNFRRSPLGDVSNCTLKNRTAAVFDAVNANRAGR